MIFFFLNQSHQNSYGWYLLLKRGLKYRFESIFGAKFCQNLPFDLSSQGDFNKNLCIQSYLWMHLYLIDPEFVRLYMFSMKLVYHKIFNKDTHVNSAYNNNMCQLQQLLNKQFDRFTTTKLFLSIFALYLFASP